MSELLIIKRNWDSVIIRVQVKEGDSVEIDVPIDSFEKKLVDKVVELLPSLSMSFAKNTIEKTVGETVRKAFVEITQDLKNETIRVV
jgi:hypothetical protein